MLTHEELMREAAASGFQLEPLEKMIHLLELLEALRSHPFLKDRLVLKGGTALNVRKHREKGGTPTNDREIG